MLYGLQCGANLVHVGTSFDRFDVWSFKRGKCVHDSTGNLEPPLRSFKHETTLTGLVPENSRDASNLALFL